MIFGSAPHIAGTAVGASIAIGERMSNMQRASLAMALLVLAWAVTPVVADTETVSVATGSFGVVGGLGALVARVASRLSEPGVLLIWGTGLAAVSRVLSRKPSGK
jgi:hypothetical protein